MDKVVHFEIPAANMARAKKFYSGVFGWQVEEVPGMEYTVVRTVKVDKHMMPKESGAINGGIMKRGKDAKSPVILVGVKNIAASMKKAKAAGAKVTQPTQKVMDMGLYSRIKDPEGNVIGLWQNLQKRK